MALDIVPLWAVFVGSLATALLGAELGHRLGGIRHRSAEHEKEPTVGGIVAAELGLLAFLLAFTFGLAASRFESRRGTLLDEANAIGTTFLRAKMLPEPEQSEIRQLLREYVDVRLAAVQEGQLESGIRRSTEIQDELWKQATFVAEKDTRSIPTGLFIQSLNDLIDLHSKRLMIGIRSRIPITVWLVLSTVAILSFGSLGYHSGLSGARRSPVVLSLALTFAIVIWMVVDLDRPQEGFLRVSQQPMIELRSSMAEPKP
ncbi:MAG TPA: hypothetical protein VMJ32_12025 [Pirellulales bacterium]|nr:hypothetical protein [Pirellulales bacterium]